MRQAFAGPGGLIRFIKHFWDVLEPTAGFVDGWAVRAICRHLESVSSGDITRLLINVPPGFAKSLIVNVFWPAWEWATIGAHIRYISFSYASHLTQRDNEKFRDLMLSTKFQELYGREFALVKIGSEKVQSDKTGWKFASSVGGVGTGERADRVLLDDPHNVREAESETVRDNTVQWFREAMQNRLNDLARGTIIVIMQRVNEGDVSGCILEHYPDYDHLMIPMEFEADRRCQTSIGWVDPRNYDGQLAWEERYPAKVLTPFKSMDFVWASQYQQRPEPRGGGIVKRDYWRIWDREAQDANDVKPNSYPPFDYILASFDGAFGRKQENDWSALTVWGTFVETDETIRQAEQLGTPSIMLIAAWRKKLTLNGKDDLVRIRGETEAEFKDRQKENWGLVQHVADTCRRFKVDKLLVEAKANGHDVANEMIRQYGREDWIVVLDDPGQYDKISRTYAMQPYFADGRVWRPETDWADMVETEMAQFPKGAHDDLHDTAIAALRHLKRMGLLVRAEESAAAVEEMRFPSIPQRRGKTVYEQ